MKRAIKALPLLLLFCAATAAWGQVRPVEEFEVRVLPQAEVFGESFTLGEIAELDGFNLQALQRLSQVKIGASPKPGRALRVNEALVRSRLMAARFSPQVKLIVPPRAMVLRAAQVVPVDQITQIVLEHAARNAGAREDDELKQTLTTPLSEVVLPKGEVTWQVAPMGEHLVGGGTRAFRVSATVNGREAWKTMVRVRQKIYRNVLVARRPIHRNQKIKAEDLALVRQNISANRGGPYITSKQKVVGRLAKRSLGRNEPIRQALLAAPLDLIEGGRVTVIYESGTLLLKAPGVALVQGRIGQFIPVRNLESGKIVHGILQADETVKVN
ncbi:MAG: flagellar basal body P-ring formation chaperone FlgA [SAR324 cluster bacterium]|nr:flagellar basal body P-ring formation chaperone FlgA [SAR324 cluster bacterium]MCZ6645434.1 flagellar basal body P-ring formation chaperone FlgA [SAR324 cluster bacterium]